SHPISYSSILISPVVAGIRFALWRSMLVTGRLLIVFIVGKGQVGRFIEVGFAPLGVGPEEDAYESDNENERDKSAESSRIHNLTSA
ncbi:hypothetical protein, partial [Pectobacterium atrosepticum]|uniref:hypothetical protein n=1 Tax=Pectobacterium atrosepticum TaxID=29471 RepID=UPI003D7064F8